jgi:UDP-N-acetylmuramyl tripeptide synthase
LLDELQLDGEIFHRIFDGGANIGFTAEEDMLYSACEINETAYYLMQAELTGNAPDEAMQSIEALRKMVAEERNPALIALINRANAEDVTYLTDDDEFSLGMGESCEIWPVTDLPNPDDLDWSKYTDVPVAFVTGTNGKTTSVRMADAVAKAAGFTSGITNTDFIRAGDEILDRGDYSGPGGARTLIRHKEPNLVILEVARGGMLRRGLGTHRARAALITNVANDHLGQYGINTVAELTGAKGVVSRGLDHRGTLVLNADDLGLVNYFKGRPDLVRGKLTYFGLNHESPILKKAIEDGHTVIQQKHGQIELIQNGVTVKVLDVADIPVTLGGAAQHNVANAMGVIGLCLGLGIKLPAIREGLSHYKGDVKDNPGRGNYFDYKGGKVLIDFAHNPHSLTAIINTVNNMPAKRKLIMLGHAGDRTDDDINNLTDVALKLNPDMVVTAEIPDYLRGRELHEIPDMIKQHCVAEGMSPDQVHYAETCLDGAKFALDWMAEGDFVLLLQLDQRDEVFKLLE